jgi:hypothetical protein
MDEKSNQARRCNVGGSRLSYALIPALVIVIGVAMTISNVQDVSHQRQEMAPEYYMPLFGYRTDDLREIASQQGPTVRVRFVFYLQLREVAEGASLTAFPGSGLYAELLLGLGKLEAFSVADYDPTLTEDEEQRIRDGARYEGELMIPGREVVNYVISAEPPAADLITLRGADRSVLITERALFRAVVDPETRGD